MSEEDAVKNRDLLASLIRTIVPVIVGAIIAGLARAGLDLDPDQLTGVLEALVVGGYYTLVRALEARWPALGWFLGLPTQPTYQRPGDGT